MTENIVMDAFNHISALEKKLEKVNDKLKYETDALALCKKNIENDKNYKYCNDQFKASEQTRDKIIAAAKKAIATAEANIKAANDAYEYRQSYLNLEIKRIEETYENKQKNKKSALLIAERDSLVLEINAKKKEANDGAIYFQKIQLEKMKNEAAARLAAEKAAEERKRAEDLEKFNRERAMVKAQEEQRARQRTEEAKKQYAEESKRGGLKLPPPPPLISAPVVNEIMSSVNRFLSMSLEEYSDIGERMRRNPDDFEERDIDDHDNAWYEKFEALEMQEKAALDEKVQGWNKKYEAMSFDALVAIDPSNMSEKEAGIISKVMIVKEREAKNRAAIASVGAAPKIKMMPKQVVNRVAPVY